jgi:hypothetical protein
MEELNKDSEDSDQSYNIVRLVDVFRSVSFTYIVNSHGAGARVRFIPRPHPHQGRCGLQKFLKT